MYKNPWKYVLKCGSRLVQGNPECLITYFIDLKLKKSIIKKNCCRTPFQLKYA